MTINGARGCNRKIGDRFDLTLECIRRHYQREESPLSRTLSSYREFFELFGDFRGYVEFFLLQDLVAERDTVTLSTTGSVSTPLTSNHAYPGKRLRRKFQC